MKHWTFRTALIGTALALLWGVAHAQYRPAPRKEAPVERDEFGEAVSLQRFRKTGNIAWDTQELIRSGLTALHEEHREILREVEALRGRLQGLEDHLERIEAKL